MMSEGGGGREEMFGGKNMTGMKKRQQRSEAGNIYTAATSAALIGKEMYVGTGFWRALLIETDF